MQSREIVESSGYSLAGSFTPDLVFSKLWLLKELNQIQPQIDRMYVLGAWYSNLAILARHFNQPRAKQIINVETNSEFLHTGESILRGMGAHNVYFLAKDANDVEYDVTDQSVVVNTSLTDMQGRAWFDNIPAGTLVALQGRDHDPNRNFHSAGDIQRRFPLSTVLYHGELELEDPETPYSRVMTIGKK